MNRPILPSVGSAVKRTSCLLFLSHSVRSLACVDLPQPSIPSNTMNICRIVIYCMWRILIDADNIFTLKMDSSELESYRKAGKIGVEVRAWSRKLVKPGAKLLDIAEAVESKIFEKGGRLAFPVNVCVNEVTAHYTPKFNDTAVLTENDVVSVDLGVHVDGFIADMAYTVDLTGEYSKLLEVNELALEKSIEVVRPGASVSEIGEIVQSTITSAGYKPIENLTGHEVKQYDLPAGLWSPSTLRFIRW
jgi:methionine aminopeptidase